MNYQLRIMDLESGLRAALRWMYLDTAEIVLGERPIPMNASSEFVADVSTIRRALQAAKREAAR